MNYKETRRSAETDISGSHMNMNERQVPDRDHEMRASAHIVPTRYKFPCNLCTGDQKVRDCTTHSRVDECINRVRELAYAY